MVNLASVNLLKSCGYCMLCGLCVRISYDSNSADCIFGSIQGQLLMIVIEKVVWLEGFVALLLIPLGPFRSKMGQEMSRDEQHIIKPSKQI